MRKVVMETAAPPQKTRQVKAMCSLSASLPLISKHKTAS